MAASPPVTVLMPVYNGAEYLAESIDSILRQSFSDFEFLIINDGSRDGSQAILEDYARRDPRIRLLQQDNMGLAATLNKGLGTARGEFVARQDQDDLSKPDRLHKQLAWMQAHSDCALLGTRASILADRVPTDRAHDHPAFNAVLKLDLLFNNPFVHSSVMLRRHAVLAVGGYCTDRSRQPPEDYELWARIARTARVGNLPERLLEYREAAQSMSRSGDNPFQSKMLLLVAENLALTSGLVAADEHCRDIAALFHVAPQARSARPKIAAMEAVLQRCFDCIAPEVASPQEQREFEARCAFWLDNLRHHYQSQAVLNPVPLGPAPSVTVLMPVYNGAEHVAEAIDSILAQTLADFEFLVINDGSTDSTQAILERYAARDRRMRVVQQANRGLAATLNRGLELATGDLVARQDHDDLSLAERLEKQRAYMWARPHCLLVGTRARIWSGRKLTDRAHDHSMWNAALKLDLLFDNPFVHSSVMLRRQAALQLGGYSTDPAREPPEDYEFWSRMSRAGYVSNLPERLLHYREVPTSLSRKGENPFRDKLVLLSSENLALGSGVDVADPHCRDIAALFHQAPQARSPKPDLGAMQAVLQRCFDRIVPEIEAGDERREMLERWDYWRHALHRHYVRQVLQPAWAHPITLGAWRGARFVVRKLRSLARKVVS